MYFYRNEAIKAMSEVEDSLRNISKIEYLINWRGIFART